MRVLKVLAGAAIAVLLAACGGGTMPGVSGLASGTQSATGATIPSRTLEIDGMTVHVLPALGVKVLDEQGPAGDGRQVQSTPPLSNLTYHGGPIQHTPKIYIVFWGPKWTTSNGEYKALTGFFNAIGGRGWVNIDTQYNGTNGYVTNPTSQLGGAWIDTSAPPSSPSSSAVGAEAQKAYSHFKSLGVGYSIDHNYFVAIQSGNDPGGFKSSWCAWHSYETETEGKLAYTDFPYQADAAWACGGGSVNYPGTYDGVTIVGGHEAAETQTDPLPNTGWVDSGGSEIGDKCAWVNMIDNSAAGGYPTQPLWDNRKNTCEQSGP